MSEPKNVAASVRQRLLNRAHETRRPLDELLQYYAMERFLYRLSLSEHHDKFVLKGALMFTVWQGPKARASRDMDFAGKTQNTLENITAIVKAVCQTAAEPDGMEFDTDSVKAARIKEDADYEGVRVRFLGRLGKARAPMQIDVAFGDAITPGVVAIDYPVILDMPAPKLKGYPRETVLAEKFQAMVFLGRLNSRMKDFYDAWLLAQQFDFDGPALSAAVRETFAHRKTGLTIEPFAFSEAFWADPQKNIQWRGFIDKSRIANAPKDLEQVVSALKELLLPVAQACLRSEPLKKTWRAPGPWK